MKVRGLLDEAFRLHRAGESQKAEVILESVLAESPREIEALVALGIVAAESGKPDPAIRRMRQALEVDPKCLQALRWLCGLLIGRQQFEEAERYAKQIVSLDPQNPKGHVLSARCLTGLERRQDAIKAFQRAVALNPSDAFVLYEFAGLLSTLRFERDATNVLRKAVLLDPNPRGLLSLASLEFGLGKIEDAEKYCRRALRKDPTNVTATLLMGRILTEQRKLEEADVHWLRAAELGASPGAIPLEKALALNTIGHFDDAHRELIRSIEAKPAQGAAYQSLVFGKRVVADDLPIVRQMERLVGENGISEKERLSLLYSLGKAFDDLGDYERAIEFFDRAKELTGRLWRTQPFNKVAFTAHIDAKIRIFSKEFFANWRQERLRTSLPIPIVGMMRSGTTLAEQILTCHPKIGSAGEQVYWTANDGSVVDYGRLTVSDVSLQRCGKEYVDLLTSISPGFPRVIDKDPLNVFLLGSFHLAFPNSPIIHTRRNAVDTALSIWMTPMSGHAIFTGERSSIVHAYKEYLRLSEHWQTVIPPDRLLDVQYEDLVSEPEVYAKKMVAFCGQEWDEACLRPELNERRVVTPSFWQVRQPVYKTSTERWKHYEPWLGEFEELKGLD